MWNLTALDTSTTTNRRSYFHSAVTRKASSTARETFCAVIPTPSNFSPSTHAPNHTPRHAPARTSHRSPSRATYPTTPPHHTPASHPCTTCPITPPHHAPAPHAPAPSPPQSRMQFPHGTNRRTLKNRGISTIRLQNLKHSQGNCMRNCCARGRQGQGGNTRTTGTPD